MKVGTLFSLILLSTLSAWADRSVSILPAGTSVVISNPSQVNLNYNLTCYQGNGSSYLNNNYSLNTNQTQSHSIVGSATACAETVQQTYDNNMARCFISTPQSYATAITACSAGFHVCTLDEWQANQGSWPTTDAAWLDIGGMTSYSFYNGTWIDYLTSSMMPVTSGVATEKISTGSMGAGTQYNKVYRMTTGGTSSMTMCCGTPVVGHSSCKITVTGNSGHLICPDFKAGTPF